MLRCAGFRYFGANTKCVQLFVFSPFRLSYLIVSTRMYIRKSSRTTKGKTYINYVLVESVLTPKGPRQKIICSLGDLRPRPQGDWLALAHKLTSALSGQADLLAAPDPDLHELVTKEQS